MARIIAVANQKGGVGKTTTTLNLGSALHKEGKRVLLVDLDPQAALSTSLDSGFDDGEKTVYDVLLSGGTASRVARRTRAGPALIPANIDLAAAEVELVAEMGRERILAEALEPVRDRYDFILIDCPPSLGLLTINALVAARDVIIPLQSEYLAMRGLDLLLKTIERIRTKLNRDLEVAGILMTMYNGRTVHAQEVLEEVRRSFLEVAQGSPYYVLIYLALATGARMGELLGLRWSDLDLDSGMMRITRTAGRLTGVGVVFSAPKTRRAVRPVALSPDTVDLLRRHRRAQLENRVRLGPAYQDQDLVFAWATGEPRDRAAVRVAFQRLAARAGVEGLRFHDLRHTAATVMLAAGVNPKVVSERLGHATVAFTLDTYSHVLPDMQREAAQAMDRLLGRPAGRPSTGS